MRLRFFHIGMICNRRYPYRKRESITVCFSNRLSKMENCRFLLLKKEDRENLPDIYVSYVSDYVSLINTYLDKLPEEQRWNILSFYEAWSIPDVVMSDYLVFGDSVVFSLGEMQAVEMGIPEENYRSMLQTVKNFNTLGAKGKVNYEMKNVGSLFMNHDLFDEVHESLARDFDELNRKYGN